MGQSHLLCGCSAVWLWCCVIAVLCGSWGPGGLQGGQSSLEMLAFRIDDAFISKIIDVLLYSGPSESKVPGFLLVFLLRWGKQTREVQRPS